MADIDKSDFERLLSEIKLVSTKVDKVQTDLSSKLSTMTATLTSLATTVTDLNSKCGHLEKQNISLRKEVETLTTKLDYLENQSRRNNLLFHGIPKVKQQETWKDCEDCVREILKNTMEIDTDVVIERAHRVDWGKSIIVKFLDFNVKSAVLGKSKLLKDTGYSVSEDFSYAVRQKRKHLKVLMDDARERGERCRLRFDKLIFENGKTMTYDLETNSPVQLAKTQPRAHALTERREDDTLHDTAES
ncbi:uncharacterized protein [Haliotis cracherodii]|uniref:uncharacterized protein n=1 Tax=Haliotis cracherodii TaxID=6455 RepID=UPI0039ED6EC5